jgi:hypothetical protein
MNIRKYMNRHEARVREALRTGSAGDLEAAAETHKRMLAAMQHERTIHLLVTLAFGSFFLITLAVAAIRPAVSAVLLSGLFFLPLVPYVFHYYFLENAVQRWYTLSDELENKRKSRLASDSPARPVPPRTGGA